MSVLYSVQYRREFHCHSSVVEVIAWWKMNRMSYSSLLRTLNSSDILAREVGTLTWRLYWRERCSEIQITTSNSERFNSILSFFEFVELDDNWAIGSHHSCLASNMQVEIELCICSILEEDSLDVSISDTSEIIELGNSNSFQANSVR